MVLDYNENPPLNTSNCTNHNFGLNKKPKEFVCIIVKVFW